MTKTPVNDPAECPFAASDTDRSEAPMTAEVVERMAARLDILDSQVFECLSRPPTMAEIEERFDAMLKQFGLPLGD